LRGRRSPRAATPRARRAAPAGARPGGAAAGTSPVNPAREGLNSPGGSVGGAFAAPADLAVRPAGDGGALPLPVPTAPGDPAGIWEMSRLAAPLPTILPSYNQIGFDSLHFLIGLVESTADGQAIAWVGGARLPEDQNRTILHPA